MTKKEFQAWKEETERSRHHWVVDEVQLQNTGGYLFFKGGQNGQFIQVDKNGLASVGTYAGAIPCITDACFQIKHSKQFPNQNEAITTLIEQAGLSFLLDFIGSRAYQS